jgi:DNA-binding beta-propeller fold protein YncE
MLGGLSAGPGGWGCVVTVFVSYSSRDKDGVKSLTQDLQDAEEQVWMDQRLAGGDAWWRAILEQIRGCDVFIFALSQNSIQSKPCQAELHYAQGLGLPILPVQVGPVDSMQLNPLATVQTIDYRTPTPSTAMRLISALNRTRAQRQPLPSPLPVEPEVPFEYLIRLYITVAGPDQLSPRDQAALVAQLQVGLREDGDHDAARNDIVALLTKLRDREDVTYRTRTDVEAILASIDSQSAAPPPPSVTNLALPTSAPEPTHLDDPGPITAAPPTPPARDPGTTPPALVNPARPSPRQPLWQRLSRRTKIAAVIAVIAVIAAVIAAVIPGQHAAEPQPVAGELPFTGLNNPYGVAVDTAGNLYVTDSGNNRVLKLAAGSNTQSVLPFTGLHNPAGVAVDAAGNLYVTDANTDAYNDTNAITSTNYANSQVLKLAAGSNTQSVLPFTDLHIPLSVAVDAAGNLYVTDANKSIDGRVLKLAAGSNTQSVLPFTGLDFPAGVAVDSAGTLYVVDKGAANAARGHSGSQVLKLAAGSNTQSVLPFTGLDRPTGVAVDAAGTLYVANIDNTADTDQVLKLAAGSNTQSVLPFPDLYVSQGVAVDTAGTVYVVDAGRIPRVLKPPAGS